MIADAMSLRQLGDVVKVISGYAFKSAEFGETGVPVIKIKNIRAGSVDISAPARVAERFLDLNQKYHVLPGDLLISLTGSHLTQPNSVVGRVARLGRNQAKCLLNQRAGKISVREGANVDLAYIYYVLGTSEFGKEIAGMASGAANQANISPTQVESLEVPLPDLPTQRKIAGILSAYDDLIENNLRRIRILEEMAQSLYREWFVHFRFPGHESVKMVDSPLGPIPKGWEVKPMPEAIEVRPKIPVPKSQKVPFIPMGSLSENSMLIEDVETRPKATGARFQNGDTLFARITPCLENGKTGYVQFLKSDDAICCGSTEFIVLRSKTVCPEYVYLMARSDPFRDNAIKSMSGATGRQRVRDECFDQFFLAQPPEVLLEKFRVIVQPQFKLIRSLNLRNQTLRQTRDLLLPKLLSGSES